MFLKKSNEDQQKIIMSLLEEINKKLATKEKSNDEEKSNDDENRNGKFPNNCTLIVSMITIQTL